MAIGNLGYITVFCVSNWRVLCAAYGVQENYFFDGPSKELNSRFVVLRVRFYDVDKKAVLTLKVCVTPLC